MFSRILVENDCFERPIVQTLRERFSNIEFKSIDKIENYFGRVKKPYLEKRNELQLFIGKKRGELVKEAPPAYGLSGEPHYYYVHSYNCIYECEYCYLQGHFDSPDLVWFINHEEIIEEMKGVLSRYQERVWFHAGEFSDSLALSHLTNELSEFHQFFREYPRAQWELRTKSVNIKEILKLGPLPNLYVSFSLSPEEESRAIDLKTPGLKARLEAMKKLAVEKFQLGIHFDPIVYSDDFLTKYQKLIQQICDHQMNEQIAYISLGVVRFTKDVYHQVQKNYPNSIIHSSEFIKGSDNKIRYPRPMRLWMLQKVKSLCIEAGIDEEKIYLCME
ncbi:MAG: hypothetical protein Fur0010_16170 [Bdellovibrio sp.]